MSDMAIDEDLKDWAEYYSRMGSPSYRKQFAKTYYTLGAIIRSIDVALPYLQLIPYLHIPVLLFQIIKLSDSFGAGPFLDLVESFSGVPFFPKKWSAFILLREAMSKAVMPTIAVWDTAKSFLGGAAISGSSAVLGAASSFALAGVMFLRAVELAHGSSVALRKSKDLHYFAVQKYKKIRELRSQIADLDDKVRENKKFFFFSKVEHSELEQEGQGIILKTQKIKERIERLEKQVAVLDIQYLIKKKKEELKSLGRLKEVWSGLGACTGDKVMRLSLDEMNKVNQAQKDLANQELELGRQINFLETHNENEADVSVRNYLITKQKQKARDKAMNATAYTFAGASAVCVGLAFLLPGAAVPLGIAAAVLGLVAAGIWLHQFYRHRKINFARLERYYATACSLKEGKNSIKLTNEADDRELLGRVEDQLLNNYFKPVANSPISSYKEHLSLKDQAKICTWQSMSEHKKHRSVGFFWQSRSQKQPHLSLSSLPVPMMN